MQKRVWIKSGIVEELDAKQVRLLNLVYQQIVFYYRHLYQTRPCFQYPLSLSRLMKLCHRASPTVSLALRYLANTVPAGTDELPPIYYDRVQAQKNASSPKRVGDFEGFWSTWRRLDGCSSGRWLCTSPLPC